MTKYHIKKDGMPGACAARPGNCPLGSDDEHFDNKLDAIMAAEEKLSQESRFLESVKRQAVYHVSETGAVEECKYRDGLCEVKPFGKFKNLHANDPVLITGSAQAFREMSGQEAAEEPATPAPAIPVRKDPVRRPPRPMADDPITRRAYDIRNDGYDRYRKDGWSEEEIDYYRDSCGHSYPPGRSPRPTRGSSC